MDIDNIEHHFNRGDDWFGSFDCPNCNQEWGPSNQGDPPGDLFARVKCDCGAILDVGGEWVSRYEMGVEQVDDE